MAGVITPMLSKHASTRCRLRNIIENLLGWVGQLRPDKDLRVAVDIDPQSFF